MLRDFLGGIALWYAALRITPDATVAYIGVPANVLVACAVGAFCSFSFGDKVEPRGRLWRLFMASLLMGAAFTAICNAALQHFLHMEMTAGLHAGLASVVSFITRFFLPWLIDVVSHGKWLSWLPFNRSGK